MNENSNNDNHYCEVDCIDMESHRNDHPPPLPPNRSQIVAGDHGVNNGSVFAKRSQSLSTSLTASEFEDADGRGIAGLHRRYSGADVKLYLPIQFM